MERVIEVRGGRLYVRSEGSGPPIVLLHSAIADHRSWDGVAPGLVEAGYRVIRYDLRGFGRSVALDQDFSERDDLRAVMDDLGVVRAALVGNSRGGHVAMDTAIETPDRVEAVVTFGTVPGGFRGGSSPEEDALDEEWERLRGAPVADPDALADLDVRAWVDGPGQPATRVPAAIREAVREAARPLYVPGHVMGRRVRLAPEANDRLGEVRCPILAVAGALDLVHIVEGVRRIEEGAPNARAIIWPDVAHMVAMEQPARSAALISEFLAPLPPWS